MMSHEKDFRFLNLTNYLRAKNCFFRICLEKIRMQLLLHCSMFLFGFVLLDLVPIYLIFKETLKYILGIIKSILNQFPYSKTNIIINSILKSND